MTSDEQQRSQKKWEAEHGMTRKGRKLSKKEIKQKEQEWKALQRKILGKIKSIRSTASLTLEAHDTTRAISDRNHQDKRTHW